MDPVAAKKRRFLKEKQERLEVLRKEFSQPIVGKMLESIIEELGLKRTDIPFPTSFAIDEVLREQVFFEVLPDFLIENYAENLERFSKPIA